MGPAEMPRAKKVGMTCAIRPLRKNAHGAGLFGAHALPVGEQILVAQHLPAVEIVHVRSVRTEGIGFVRESAK